MVGLTRNNRKVSLLRFSWVSVAVLLTLTFLYYLLVHYAMKDIAYFVLTVAILYFNLYLKAYDEYHSGGHNNL